MLLEEFENVPAVIEPTDRSIRRAELGRIILSALID